MPYIEREPAKREVIDGKLQTTRDEAVPIIDWHLNQFRWDVSKSKDWGLIHEKTNDDSSVAWFYTI